MQFTTDPQNILRTVDIVFQVFENNIDRYDGLFPAVAERSFGTLLMDWPLPPPIPGQRNSDRSPRGCNLSHDVALLCTLDGLNQRAFSHRYHSLLEGYLETFATLCAPASPTGLLPWGEHAFWRLTDHSIGNSYHLQYYERAIDAGAPTHHQICTLPLWIWKKLHAHNSELIPRFVNGLDWHWMDEERTFFNRHAPITQFIRGYPVKRHDRMTGKLTPKTSGSDFPSASGTFIHDYAAAMALVEQPDPAWQTALERFSHNWWNRRLDSGLLPRSGGQHEGPSPAMTLALGIKCLQAGAMLNNGVLLERGTSYVKAVLDVEQPDAEKGWIWMQFSPENKPSKHSQPWAGNRGSSVTAQALLSFLWAGETIGDARGLDLAVRAAGVYKSDRMARDLIVRAGDPGLVIGLCTELYRLTEEREWLDAALMHATDAMELYFDLPLPRMSTGRSHYEPQQGSSVLIHALARLALIAEGEELKGGLKEAYR